MQMQFEKNESSGVAVVALASASKGCKKECMPQICCTQDTATNTNTNTKEILLLISAHMCNYEWQMQLGMEFTREVQVYPKERM